MTEKFNTDNSETDENLLKNQPEGYTWSKSFIKPKPTKKVNPLKLLQSGISIVGTQLQKNVDWSEVQGNYFEDRREHDILPGILSVTPVSTQPHYTRSGNTMKPLIINLHLNANLISQKYPQLKQISKMANQDYLGVSQNPDEVVDSLRRRFSKDQVFDNIQKGKILEHFDSKSTAIENGTVFKKNEGSKEGEPAERQHHMREKHSGFFQELPASKTSRVKGLRLASRNASRPNEIGPIASGPIPPLSAVNQGTQSSSIPRLGQNRNTNHHSTGLQIGIQKSLSKNLLILQPFEPAHPEFKRDLYYDFADKVNLSNGLVVNKAKQSQFLFYVSRGNNSELIKELLKRRWWWKQADTAKEAHFLWSQKNKLEKMKKIPIGSECQYREKKVFPITDTSSKELEQVCAQFVQANLKLKTHTTKFLASVEVKSVLEKHARCFEPGIISTTVLANIEENRLLSLGTSESEELQNFQIFVAGDDSPLYSPLTYVTYMLPALPPPTNMIYTPGQGVNKSPINPVQTDGIVISRPSGDSLAARTTSLPKSIKHSSSSDESCTMQNLSPTRPSLHNHLQNNNLLGDKKDLFLSIVAHCQSLATSSTPLDPWEILPFTVLLHPETGMSEFERVFYERQSQGLSNVWILKPAVNSNRGNGIEVCDSVPKVARFVKQHQGYVIAQVYIAEPLLYNGRKFDVRVR